MTGSPNIPAPTVLAEIAMSSSGKSKTAAADDWVGELLVGIIELIGRGLWRFALRWPDSATLLTTSSSPGCLAVCAWRVCSPGCGGGGVGVAAGLAGVLPATHRRAGRQLSASASGVSASLARHLRTPRSGHRPARQARFRPAGSGVVLGAHRRGGRHLGSAATGRPIGENLGRRKIDGLAAAFGAHRVTIQPGRVEAGRGRDIVIRVHHHDALPPLSHYTGRSLRSQWCDWRKCQ